MALRGVPLKLRFNEGIFRLSEKPDVRGKTFASFGAFAKGGRPRGRNKKPTRMPKRRRTPDLEASRTESAPTQAGTPVLGGSRGRIRSLRISAFPTSLWVTSSLLHASRKPLLVGHTCHSYPRPVTSVTWVWRPGISGAKALEGACENSECSCRSPHVQNFLQRSMADRAGRLPGLPGTTNRFANPARSASLRLATSMAALNF